MASASESTSPDRSTPEASGAKDGLHVFGTQHVAITGAFLTGHALALPPDAYASKQLALVDALEGGGWKREAPDPERGTFASGGGFSTAPPPVIVCRGGPVLLRQLRKAIEPPSGKLSIAEWLASYGAALKLEPESVDISIHALGVAVITADFTVYIAESGVLLRDLAATVREVTWLQSSDRRRISPVAEALKGIARETAERYDRAVAAAIPEAMRANGRAAKGGDRDGASSMRSRAVGRLLWLHPVTSVTTLAPVLDAARQLAPTFHETLRLGEHTVFAPGVGWSAIVSSRASVGAARAQHRSWAGDPDAPIKLTKQHWAYYALYMQFDRDLLSVLDYVRRSDAESLKQLERDAESVFAEYLRVMEARVRLDSVPIGLGGDELGIWQLIAEVQRFPQLVDGVERKIGVLKELAKHRVEQATASRSRRTGNIIGLLTALTFVTFAFALFGYFWGNLPDESGHLALRFVVITAAFAFSAGIYWLAYHRQPRASPRRRGSV